MPKRPDVCYGLQDQTDQNICKRLSLRERGDDDTKATSAIRGLPGGRQAVKFIDAIADLDEAKCNDTGDSHRVKMCKGAIIGIRTAEAGPQAAVASASSDDEPSEQRISGLDSDNPGPAAGPAASAAEIEAEKLLIEAERLMALLMDIDLPSLQDDYEEAVHASRTFDRAKRDIGSLERKRMSAQRRLARAGALDDAGQRVDALLRETADVELQIKLILPELTYELPRARYGKELRAMAKPHDEAYIAKHKANTKRLPTTKQQQKDIEFWVNGGYGTLNSALRGETDPSVIIDMSTQPAQTPESAYKNDIIERAAGMRQMMQDLQKKPGTSWRVSKVASPGVYRKDIQPGDQVLLRGFAGSSEIKGAIKGADNWANQDNLVYYEITGHSAMNLQPYHNDPKGEFEVVYGPGTVFEVLAIDNRDRGISLIKLMEVPGVAPDTTVKDMFSGKPMKTLADPYQHIPDKP